MDFLQQFSELVNGGITWFFTSFFNDLIKFFADALANITGGSDLILQMQFVKNGIAYSQAVCLAILVPKVLWEGFNTYILYESGDPDQDPTGVLVRSTQALFMVLFLPWVIETAFRFGIMVATDVAGLDMGQMTFSDWGAALSGIILSRGLSVVIPLIVCLVLLLIVFIQSTIRGAELVQMAVTGSWFALNLTSNNKSVWETWIRQLFILCLTQALQIFMVKGGLAFLTVGAAIEAASPGSVSGPVAGGVGGATHDIKSVGVLALIGWLWVTAKTPSWLKQFSYSTGFTGAMGGAVKQGGMMTAQRAIYRSVVK